MAAVESLDGEVVRRWLGLAADGLAGSRSAIDMLNVFPVPDADTGTNLHATMASAAHAVAGLAEDASAAEIWQTAAAAAFRGACGNSGIILSQLLRGMAETCAAAAPCDGRVVAAALANAARMARSAVRRPVDGTVLTVADAAAQAAARVSDLADVGRAAARGARHALAQTQRQLGVLAERGVVDAGGAGLCVVLDALSAAITGTHPDTYEVPAPSGARGSGQRWPAAGEAGSQPCYEVTFLIDAPGDAVASLQDRLDQLGDSLVVSGSGRQWHVHVHVADGGAAIEAGLAAGRLSKITITYLNGIGPGIPAGKAARAGRVVAVADGAGLRVLLESTGAIVVSDRPGSSPSAELAELAGLGDPSTLLAPPALGSCWPQAWPVVEIGSAVQAIAALAVHDPARDARADAEAMRRAVAGMRWASVSDEMPGPDQVPAAISAVDELATPGTELITVLLGQAAGPEIGPAVASHVAAAAPAAEVVCYDGGMTSAVLLIGAE
jgi:dihydroxyacetone kinase-like predicted kinase